jgi:hypothetical protein
MKNETLSDILKFHGVLVERAAEALARALADAAQAAEFALRRAGLLEARLVSPVPYIGPDGDYHARLVAVRVDPEEGLVFVDDCGETVDAQSLESDALREALGRIDLGAAAIVA